MESTICRELTPVTGGSVVAGRGRRPSGARPSLRSTWGRTLRLWKRRARSRRRLLTLDARALADIGISPLEAEHEGNKPFWKP